MWNEQATTMWLNHYRQAKHVHFVVRFMTRRTESSLVSVIHYRDDPVFNGSKDENEVALHSKMAKIMANLYVLGS